MTAPTPEQHSAESGAPLPLPVVFRRIAEEPVDGRLDRMTWRAAFLAAARIAEEARPIPQDQARALGIDWPPPMPTSRTSVTPPVTPDD